MRFKDDKPKDYTGVPFDRLPAEEQIKRATKIGIRIFLTVILAVLIMSIVFGAWYKVPKGSMGCEFSNVNGWNYNEQEQGWHLKLPIVESVEKLTFRTQTLGVHEGDGGQYGVLTPKDKNGINYKVDVTVRYKLDNGQICEFIEQKGSDVEALLLTALRADSTRGVFGQYAQEDVPLKRIEIAAKVIEVLQKRINLERSGKLNDNFLIIEAVDIRNVQFDPKIEAAIIDKQTRKQEAEKQDYILQQAEKEKEIRIVQASATKEAAILEAEGRGEAILIEATAKAEGIKKVNTAYQNMPTQYVEVKYAEAMNSLATKGNTVVMDLGRFSAGTNTLGFLDYNKFIAAQQSGSINTS